MENTTKNGMICSKRFADWMIEKNQQDTDYPAQTYYKLIRLFCRTNYSEFYAEEECKGNEFLYNILVDGDRIVLKSTYDLVFLPYDGRAVSDAVNLLDADIPESVDYFVPGYRVLQTRGYMPGSAAKAFKGEDCFCVKYIVDEILLMADRIEDFAKSHDLDIDHILTVGEGAGLGYNHIAGYVKLDDVFRASEFQAAEERGFIDNEYPYSMGPQCPDKIICRQMYTRIIGRLMKEADRLGLVSGKDSDSYELRVASYVAAILSFVTNDGFSLSQGISRNSLEKRANELFDEYLLSSGQELDAVCRRIRIGLLWSVTVVIDRSSRICFDYDCEDVTEAPIGLTSDDYDRFGYTCEPDFDDSYEDEYLDDDPREEVMKG